MIELHAATFLLQWATGGLLFGWVTTRRREVGIGYGWSIRITFGLMAALGLALGVTFGFQPVREAAAAGLILATAFALGQSVVRRSAGVKGQRQLAESRSGRVAAMTGIDLAEKKKSFEVAEFDPRLDLLAPVIGMVGVVAAAAGSGGPFWLAAARFVVGALFLGAVTDAMLLGHWYLVQPGLKRDPLHELIRWTGFLWLPEVLLFLVPTGMVSVWNGSIDDGYAGMLGWFWGACCVTTIGLVFVTLAALKEKQYSAVMAATGLLYLAILTGFGIDLVARAALSFG